MTTKHRKAKRKERPTPEQKEESKPAPLKTKGCGTQIRIRALRLRHPPPKFASELYVCATRLYVCATRQTAPFAKDPTFARSGRTWGTPGHALLVGNCKRRALIAGRRWGFAFGMAGGGGGV
jgi:hypothetical protein